MVVKTWLLRNGWSSKVPISNAKRLVHKCRDIDCPFTLKINASSKGIRLTKLIHHTCPISTHDKWRGRSSIAVMSKDPLNIALFVDDPKTKPAQIRRQELRIYGNHISMHLAWEVCERIKRDLHGDEEKSFQKIPGLLLAMQLGQVLQRRRETHHFCEYDLDIYADQFVRCWVLPQATKEAFRHCRKFVTMDGT